MKKEEYQKLAKSIFEMPHYFKRFGKQLSNNRVNFFEMHLLSYLSHEKELSMTIISNKLHISKPNLTAIVDKLVKEGYVQRKFDESDRRLILIELTEKGQEYQQECSKARYESVAKMFEKFSDDDFIEFNKSIETITKILNKYSENEGEKK